MLLNHRKLCYLFSKWVKKKKGGEFPEEGPQGFEMFENNIFSINAQSNIFLLLLNDIFQD